MTVFFTKWTLNQIQIIQLDAVWSTILDTGERVVPETLDQDTLTWLILN